MADFQPRLLVTYRIPQSVIYWHQHSLTTSPHYLLDFSVLHSWRACYIPWSNPQFIFHSMSSIHFLLPGISQQVIFNRVRLSALCPTPNLEDQFLDTRVPILVIFYDTHRLCWYHHMVYFSFSWSYKTNHPLFIWIRI